MEDPEQEEVEDIGLVGRMVRVFYAPVETFDALRLRRTWLDWFVPVLLVAISGMASAYLVGPIAMEEKMAEMQNNPDVSAEQREALAGVMEKQQEGPMAILGVVFAPIGSFVGILILAGILLAFSKLALGAEIEYGQMLPVTAYASLIGLLNTIVVLPLMVQKQTLQIHTGLGIFVSDALAKTFLGRLITGVDLFGLWTACVVGIGIAIVGNLPTRKAVTGTLILWGIWIVIKAGLGGIAAMFLPGN